MGAGTQIAIAISLLCAGSAASAADEQPICADRPGKANPTCTVPAGMVQIETGLIDWTHDRSDGIRSDSLALAATAIKYGLTDRWHIEVDVAPYNSQRVHGDGFRARDSGFGDVAIASKYRLTGGDGVQVALSPRVKLPTAKRPIGNRKWEAGLAIPIDYSIPNSKFGIAIGPELDWVADSDGHGHHVAMVQVASLSWQASDKFNFSGEVWGQWDWDPAGTTRQASADGSVAYLLSNNVQLDAGANFGLNRNTPDVELYTGVSTRF